MGSKRGPLSVGAVTHWPPASQGPAGPAFLCHWSDSVAVLRVLGPGLEKPEEEEKLRVR